MLRPPPRSTLFPTRRSPDPRPARDRGRAPPPAHGPGLGQGGQRGRGARAPAEEALRGLPREAPMRALRIVTLAVLAGWPAWSAAPTIKVGAVVPLTGR